MSSSQPAIQSPIDKHQINNNLPTKAAKNSFTYTTTHEAQERLLEIRRMLNSEIDIQRLKTTINDLEKKYKLTVKLDIERNKINNKLEKIKAQISTKKDTIYEQDNSINKESSTTIKKLKNQIEETKEKLSTQENTLATLEQEEESIQNQITYLTNKLKPINDLCNEIINLKEKRTKLENEIKLSEYQDSMIECIAKLINSIDKKIQQLPIDIKHNNLEDLKKQIANVVKDFLTPNPTSKLENKLDSAFEKTHKSVLKFVSEQPDKKIAINFIQKNYKIFIFSAIAVFILHTVNEKIIIPEYKSKNVFDSFFNEIIIKTLAIKENKKPHVINALGQEVLVQIENNKYSTLSEITFDYTLEDILRKRNLPSIKDLIFFNYNKKEKLLTENFYLHTFSFITNIIPIAFVIMIASITYIASKFYEQKTKTKKEMTSQVIDKAWLKFKNSTIEYKNLCLSFYNNQTKHLYLKSTNQITHDIYQKKSQAKENIANRIKNIVTEINSVDNTIEDLKNKLNDSSEPNENNNQILENANKKLTEIRQKKQFLLEFISEKQTEFEKLLNVIKKVREKITNPVMLRLYNQIDELESKQQTLQATLLRIEFEYIELEPYRIEPELQNIKKEFEELEKTIQTTKYSTCERLHALINFAIEPTAMNWVLDKHIGIDADQLRKRVNEGHLTNSLGEIIFGNTNKASSFDNFSTLEYAILHCYFDAQNQNKPSGTNIRLALNHDVGIIIDPISHQVANTAVYSYKTVVDQSTQTEKKLITHLYCE